MSIKKSELDDIAREYHLATDIPDKFIEEELQHYSVNWLLRQAGPTSNRVLELGYGDGIVTNALANAGYDLTVLEGSRFLCEQVQKKHGGRVRWVNTLFEEFESEGTYDTIIAGHVLEHVADPVGLLTKISGWLKGNASRIIIIVPNKNSIHRRLAVKMGIQPELDSLSPRDKVVGHLRVYSHETLRADVEAAGMVAVEQCGFFLKALPNSMMLTFPLPLIRALNEIGEELPKELLANIGMTLRKK